MLRVHCMQLFYNLSDPAMEDALYEIESMGQFACLKLDRLPDETTILKFRHFLEHHGLGTVRHPQRWSGNTRNWEVLGSVSLNPGKMHEIERNKQAA